MAPIATASSGFILSLIFPSPNFSINISFTFGIREEPPTNTTSSISSRVNLDSDRICSNPDLIFSYKS